MHNKLLAIAFTAATAATALFALPARATDIGVSVEISQPGVYGRVDIGRFPQPAVVVPQPVIVARPAVVMARPEPVYMWVPPGHRKNWKRYCGQYRACGVPVYFVQHGWYNDHVMDGRRGDDDHGRGRGRGHGRGHGKGGKHDR